MFEPEDLGWCAFFEGEECNPPPEVNAEEWKKGWKEGERAKKEKMDGRRTSAKELADKLQELLDAAEQLQADPEDKDAMGTIQDCVNHHGHFYLLSHESLRDLLSEDY